MAGIDDLTALMNNRTGPGGMLVDARSVVALIDAIKRKADEAWDKASEFAARGDELQSTYWWAKAHAFCEMLGDQEHLFGLVDGVGR